MKPISSLLLLSLVALAPLSPARATVDPAIIPSDARWVVYADLNALRTTSLGKELVAWAQKAQADSEKLPVGLNVEKVMALIGTMTAFGSNFSSDPSALDGTLVLEGTPDLRKIAESILLQQAIAMPEIVAESKELPFPSYTIKPKGDGKKPVASLIVAFPSERVVLIGKSRAPLLRARDAIGGVGGTVAKTPGAPLKGLLTPSRGAYLFAASMVPSEMVGSDNQPQARILKMASSGSVAIGEQGPNTFARAELLAASDDMADKLMKIVQGWIAMLSLAETNDKQLAEFMNSAAVARDDKTVTMNVSYSSERLAQMLRSVQQSHRSPEDIAAARAASIVQGKAIAEWQAEAATPASPAPLVSRTIENVQLTNGTVIALGRHSNGGKPVRFDHIEITPTAGGTPLTFRPEFMRSSGQRGNISVFEFPGADGSYTIKVSYVNDPEGKARYAVSVRVPQAPKSPDQKS